MDRRRFIGVFVGGLAASAAVRTFPFRVYSFPTDIKVVQEVPHWQVPHWQATYWRIYNPNILLMGAPDLYFST